MGAVKEMKKKDSRQTHNDNKSDCTDGEAEYETESIIKHNENIRSKNKRCNQKETIIKHVMLKMQNFSKRNKSIDNKWSNLYSDQVKEPKIRSIIKLTEEGKKHPQNSFWDFSFHSVINDVIILQFQNI